MGDPAITAPVSLTPAGRPFQWVSLLWSLMLPKVTLINAPVHWARSGWNCSFYSALSALRGMDGWIALHISQGKVIQNLPKNLSVHLGFCSPCTVKAKYLWFKPLYAIILCYSIWAKAWSTVFKLFKHKGQVRTKRATLCKPEKKQSRLGWREVRSVEKGGKESLLKVTQPLGE